LIEESKINSTILKETLFKCKHVSNVNKVCHCNQMEFESLQTSRCCMKH